MEEKTNITDIVYDIAKNMEYHLEASRLRAQLRKAHYDECIRVGFTKEEALELAKSI